MTNTNIEALRAQVAELTEWEDNKTITPEEEDQLVHLRVALRDALLDAETAGRFDISRINRHESENRSLCDFLEGFGRELAAVRGVDLPPNAGLDHYDRTRSEWVELPKGVAMIRLVYRIPCRCEDEFTRIVFPEYYLEDGSDWVEVEKKERAAREETKRENDRRVEKSREEKERAQYERLREKFEGEGQ